MTNTYIYLRVKLIFFSITLYKKSRFFGCSEKHTKEPETNTRVRVDDKKLVQN